MGRLLIALGLFFVVAGAAVMLAERFGIRLGHLPGDIQVEGKHGGFYFPIVTCLLISAIVSLISWFFRSR